MMEFQIRLNSMEDAAKLVNRLEYYDCRAEVWIEGLVTDARSLMALLRFGMGKVIRIVIHSEPIEELNEELEEFMSA